MQAIGLCGPEGAGKSAAAKMLADRGLTVLPLAAPLKRMLAAIGLPPESLYGTPDQKATPLAALCGHSARHAMQTLGTEWGRKCIGENFWCDAWRALAAQHAAVVADDVRFQNEVAAVRGLGGKVICIVRHKDDFKRIPRHPSENFQALQYDTIIVNDGTLADLERKLVAEAFSYEPIRRAG